MMGKMYDSFRAWWNDLGDRFSDPAKLAQLNVADIEKALSKAKDAATTFVGRPVRLQSDIKELEKEDYELVSKIKLLKGKNEEESAKRLVDRLLIVRKELDLKRESYQEAEKVADTWKIRIRSVEKELKKRRDEALDLKEREAAAEAMIKLGIAFDHVDKYTGSDYITKYDSKVKEKETKVVGSAAISGFDDKVALEQTLRDIEIQDLYNSI